MLNKVLVVIKMPCTARCIGPSLAAIMAVNSKVLLQMIIGIGTLGVHQLPKNTTQYRVQLKIK